MFQAMKFGQLIEYNVKNICLFFFFLKLGFTPCKTEQPLGGTELQEKEAQKN